MKYIINTYREVLLEECNRHQTPCAGVSNIVIILIVQATRTEIYKLLGMCMLHKPQNKRTNRIETHNTISNTKDLHQH
jgi:hypothetical protein